jgi:hypothetical protein
MYDGMPFFEELNPLEGQLAPYQATPKAAIAEMFDIIKLSPSDVVFDLGMREHTRTCTATYLQ